MNSASQGIWTDVFKLTRSDYCVNKHIQQLNSQWTGGRCSRVSAIPETTKIHHTCMTYVHLCRCTRVSLRLHYTASSSHYKWNSQSYRAMLYTAFDQTIQIKWIKYDTPRLVYNNSVHSPTIKQDTEQQIWKIKKSAFLLLGRTALHKPGHEKVCNILIERGKITVVRKGNKPEWFP